MTTTQRPAPGLGAVIGGESRRVQPRPSKSNRSAELSSWGMAAVPLALVLMAAVLLLDVNTGRGFAAGVLYLIPVLVMTLTGRPGAVLAIAGASTVLIALGMFFPEGSPGVQVLANRAIAVVVVWAPALIAARLMRSRAVSVRRMEQEHAAAAELHEVMRTGLTKLMTLNDQVARSAATTAQATQRIRARSQVMLTVLGILSRSRGESVELAAILRSMLPGSSAATLQIEGPPILVPARQVHAIVLVFHELLSNCRAHGALSADAGKIEASWQVEEVSGESSRRVTLRWQESGGPTIEARPTPGFGTSQISGAVVHDLSGSVEMAYPREGCRHQIRFILETPGTGEGGGRRGAGR